MTKHVTFTPLPTGRVRVRFAFDEEAVELVKATIPSPARRWDRSVRAWVIEAMFVADLARAFASIGYQVLGLDEPQAGSTWAAAMFSQLPERLHDPAFKALTKVLHPDMGGDLRAMQALNDARPTQRRSAA